MMNVKNHGTWNAYKPAKLPEAAPPKALFARRASDGVDWYAYVHPGKNFAANAIVMTVIDGRVAAATRDPTALFPAGALLLEVSGVNEPDPQKAFGRKVYNPANQTFSEPPPEKLPTTLEDILRRLEALEGRKEP